MSPIRPTPVQTPEIGLSIHTYTWLNGVPDAGLPRRRGPGGLSCTHIQP